MLKDIFKDEYIQANGALNLNQLEADIDSKEEIFNTISELNEHSLHSLFHILITNDRYEIIRKIFDKTKNASSSSKSLYTLVTSGYLKTNHNIEVFDQVNTDNLQIEDFRLLIADKKNFSSVVQEKIEICKKNIHKTSEEFKIDLEEQVIFLKDQQLNDKAQEIQMKVEFHFPEFKKIKNVVEEKIKLKNLEDQKFSNIIKRNLSFNLRKKGRLDKKDIKKIKEKNKQAIKALNQITLEWYQLFVNDIDLFIVQLEFFNFKDIEIYDFLLKNHKELNTWTRVELCLKSERYFEGLNFLMTNEKEILDNDTESVYNFYYYKGLFYQKIGMTDEAEEIFKALYEQNQNFRDVYFYLKN